MGKIQILMVLGNTGRGGAQTFAMNVLRMIDREKYQVDFAVNEIRENGYTEEIYELGSKIHVIPFFKGYNWRSYIEAWRKLLTENHYDIIHGHVSSSASIYLKEAKRHGCRTIVHSHSAGYRGNEIEQQIKKVFTLGAKKQADYWFACSKPAAERVFGKDYSQYERYYDIPNAIIAENYLFDIDKRNKIRTMLGVKEEVKIYGHVGSFTAPKNHDFLLEVFSAILVADPQAILVLCGEGERKAEIQEKARTLGIADKIILTGNVGNVHEYMMAMDVMIFPSFFEGFPITVLEAQATGLPIVLSDNITNEVFLTDCVYPLPLQVGAVEWASKCIEVRNTNRQEQNTIIASSKYNMRNCVEKIESIYQKMMSE